MTLLGVKATPRGPRFAYSDRSAPEVYTDAERLRAEVQPRKGRK